MRHMVFLLLTISVFFVPVAQAADLDPGVFDFEVSIGRNDVIPTRAYDFFVVECTAPDRATARRISGRYVPVARVGVGDDKARYLWLRIDSDIDKV